MKKYKKNSFKKALGAINYRYVNIALCSALLGIIAISVFNQHNNKSGEPVASKISKVSTPKDICQASNTITYSCYRQELQEITKSSSPESAMALIKRQYSTVPYVKSQCHQLVHIVGRAAYAKYGNIADTFAHGDQYCWSGYYHGVMEQLTNEKGYDYTIVNANSICSGIAKKQKYSFYHYNCVHGLGHGFMEVLDDNLFTALDACNKLTDSWEAQSCYGGVFMQNIMNVQSPDETVDHTSKYLKPDEPMYPCTAVDQQYKTQCYLMQTSYALQAVNNDFSKVFSLCDATDEAYRDTCYISLGRDASGQSISDASITKKTCLIGSTLRARQGCVIGAAKDFVSYFHSDTQAKEFCNILPQEIQNTCYSTVTNYYKTF